MESPSWRCPSTLGSVSVRSDVGPSGSFDVQPARTPASPNDNSAMTRRGFNSVPKKIVDSSAKQLRIMFPWPGVAIFVPKPTYMSSRSACCETKHPFHLLCIQIDVMALRDQVAWTRYRPQKVRWCCLRLNFRRETVHLMRRPEHGIALRSENVWRLWASLRWAG